MKEEMWEMYPDIWPTQASYMSWVRGGIRRGLWNKHPIKFQFLDDTVMLVDNTNPRSKKRYPLAKRWECTFCKGLFSSAKTEVDHKVGNHSLKSMDDLRAFVESMIHTRIENLQIVCKDCHKIKSYSEKEGISFEKARAEKQAIAIGKAKKDKEWLTERGIEPGSNQAKRRRQIVEEILNGG